MHRFFSTNHSLDLPRLEPLPNTSRGVWHASASPHTGMCVTRNHSYTQWTRTHYGVLLQQEKLHGDVLCVNYAIPLRLTALRSIVDHNVQFTCKACMQTVHGSCKKSFFVRFAYRTNSANGPPDCIREATLHADYILAVHLTFPLSFCFDSNIRFFWIYLWVLNLEFWLICQSILTNHSKVRQ